MSNEILINSNLVTDGDESYSYEFVLDDKMRVVECVRINKGDNKVMPVFNPSYDLDGLLFELNHVRVNPRINNNKIISKLTSALNKIGIEVFNPPAPQDIKTCFKPMGEISDNVRFYLNIKAEMIFLSPYSKPKLMLVNE